MQIYRNTDTPVVAHLLAETQDFGVFQSFLTIWIHSSRFFSPQTLRQRVKQGQLSPKLQQNTTKESFSHPALLPACLRRCSSLQLNSQFIMLLETYPTPHLFPFNSPSYDIKLYPLCQELSGHDSNASCPPTSCSELCSALRFSYAHFESLE